MQGGGFSYALEEGTYPVRDKIACVCLFPSSASFQSNPTLPTTVSANFSQPKQEVS